MLRVATPEERCDQSEEEEDLLRRSKRRNKMVVDEMDLITEGERDNIKASYKKAAMGVNEKNPWKRR